jgi:hypothetical protein
MEYIAIPDLTTFAVAVILVMAMATPYFLVRYVVRHRKVMR